MRTNNYNIIISEYIYIQRQRKRRFDTIEEEEISNDEIDLPTNSNNSQNSIIIQVCIKSVICLL